MKDITEYVESIYNDFGNILITVEKDFTILSESSDRIMGYCNKFGNIYRAVYPKTKDKRINDLIKMHEYGHIYLGHLEGIYEDLDQSLIKIIKNKDSQLIDQINKNCDIDYAEDILDKVVKDPWLNHTIHNMAMDMEVNSVILDYNDIESMKDYMNDLIFDEYMSLSNNGEILPDMRKMNNLISRFDMKGVHPSNFDFNEGLSYPDYLVLLILNLDKVLRMLSNQYNDNDKFERSLNGRDKSEDREGQGKSSQSSSKSSESDEKNDELGENPNANIPKTRDEFEDMIKNAKSLSSNKDSEKSESGSEGDGGSSDSSGGNKESDNNKNKKSDSSSSDSSDDNDETDEGSDHGTDSRKDVDQKKKNDLGRYSSSGGSGKGLNRSENVRDYVINNDPLLMCLKEIISNVRHKVIKRDYTKDMTYKYNRKVLGRSCDLLSPTYRQKITRSENPTVAFFVDVSGSMDSNLVDRIITTVRNGMKKIDRSLKYSIVTWDTELCEYYKDLDFNTPIPKISCGGGTELAGTFDLFKKDFGKDAIMVLISDFGDSLNRWHEKESKMDGYTMYGLKYGNDTWYNGGRQPNWKNLKVRQCD